jgi:hypothetical protein
MEWLTANWVSIVAVLWSLDALLDLVSPLTPWKWDDTIASWLGSMLAKFFPKKQ